MPYDQPTNPHWTSVGVVSAAPEPRSLISKVYKVYSNNTIQIYSYFIYTPKIQYIKKKGTNGGLVYNVAGGAGAGAFFSC